MLVAQFLLDPCLGLLLGVPEVVRVALQVPLLAG
jgi:hypothetical protein